MQLEPEYCWMNVVYVLSIILKMPQRILQFMIVATDLLIEMFFLNNSEKESIFFINIAQSIYQIYHNIRDCKDIIIIWVLLKTSFHRRPQWKPRVSMEELEALRWHSGSPMKSFWGLQWNSEGLMDSSILPGLIL